MHSELSFAATPCLRVHLESMAASKFKPAHISASLANAQDFTMNNHWTFSQPATLRNTFLQRRQQGNTLNKQHKYLQILTELVHLIYILASLRNSMRGLLKWLMVVRVYAIAYISINLGFHILIFLNSFYPHILSSCNVCECVSACVYVLH